MTTFFVLLNPLRIAFSCPGRAPRVSVGLLGSAGLTGLSSS
jgi:hypothetical protein